MALTLHCLCPFSSLASFHSHWCAKHSLQSCAAFASLFSTCNWTVLPCERWEHLSWLKNISKASAKRNVCSKRLQGSSLGGYVAHALWAWSLLPSCVSLGLVRAGLVVPSQGSLGTVTNSDMFNQIYWHMSTAGLAQLATSIPIHPRSSLQCDFLPVQPSFRQLWWLETDLILTFRK